MSKEWAKGAAGFIRWKPHFIGADVFRMTHVNPFRYLMALSNPATLAPAASEQEPSQRQAGLPTWARPAQATTTAPVSRPREVEIRVGFSHHVFTTKAPTPEYGSPEYRYQHGTLGRYICPDRHRLSFLLPDIVRDFRNRDCFGAKDENFLIVDFPELVADNFEYRIFFNLQSSGDSGALNLIVKSAYQAKIGDGAPAKIRDKPTGFRVLANEVLEAQNRPL